MLKKVFISLLAAVGVAAGTGVPAYAAGPYFYYAGGSQSVTDNFLVANFSVNTPTKAAADFHTLAQLSAETGSGSTRQGIEFGWTVDPVLNGGSSAPHLFVYWRKNGVGQCYNTACAGYVPYAGTSAYAAGGSLAGVTGIRLFIQRSATAWWFWAGTPAGVGDYIGYIPDSKWTTPWTSFSSFQLFGEVAAATTSPTTQMGDGNCATSTVGASIGSASLSGGPTNMVVGGGNDPTKYTVVMLSGRTFRYGGDGSCP